MPKLADPFAARPCEQRPGFTRHAVLCTDPPPRREQEALTHKVGTIATSMVSILKRLDDRMNSLSRRQQELTNTTQLIAVAVDDHTHRLTGIETRLDRIEKRLDLLHA